MNKTTTKIWDWLQKRVMAYEKKLKEAEGKNPMDRQTIDSAQERINEICAIQNYLLRVKS